MIRGAARAPIAALAWLALASGLGGCPGRRAPASPRPACPTAPVVVTSQAQLDALAGCDRLPGLTIRTAAPLVLAPLASLATVDGDLVVGPTLALDTISLPALAQVGGRLAIVSGGRVGAILLPALVGAGALEIRDDLALMQLMVPRLRTIAGPLTIVRVPELELVNAGELASIGGDLAIAAPRLATWLGTLPLGAGTRAVAAPAFAPPPVEPPAAQP